MLTLRNSLEYCHIDFQLFVRHSNQYKDWLANERVWSSRLLIPSLRCDQCRTPTHRILHREKHKDYLTIYKQNISTWIENKLCRWEYQVLTLIPANPNTELTFFAFFSALILDKLLIHTCNNNNKLGILSDDCPIVALSNIIDIEQKQNKLEIVSKYNTHNDKSSTCFVR